MKRWLDCAKYRLNRLAYFPQLMPSIVVLSLST